MTATIRPRRRVNLADLPEMLTVAEAARAIGKGRSSYYAGIASGHLPYVRLSPCRVGVPRELLQRWLRGEDTPVAKPANPHHGSLLRVASGRPLGQRR